MDLLSAPLERFLHQHAPAPDRVLSRMEEVGIERQFPIVGPVVGRFLEQLYRIHGTKTVFEMGSGFGYSTAWAARAVGPEGTVVHTDGSEKLSKEAREWLAEMGLAERIEYHVGDALELLAASGKYDAIFIDIEKEDYLQAWRIATHHIKPGGIILADNALWYGRVDGSAHDAQTRGVQSYLRAAHMDKRFLTTILPVRDGLAISLRL